MPFVLAFFSLISLSAGCGGQADTPEGSSEDGASIGENVANEGGEVSLPAEGDAGQAERGQEDAQGSSSPRSEDVAFVEGEGALAEDAEALESLDRETEGAGGAAGEPFSFFVTSLEAMQQLSGSLDGFGGNLGGLSGADEICQTIAGTVDGGGKVWRAFLSATSGPDGQPVHAIERIGEGPWYDRNGRLVALSKADLISERPVGADPQIVDDLPNEFGQGQKQFGDNHDTLSGSNAEGMLFNSDPLSTCMDWTCPGSPDCPDAWDFEKKVMGGHSWPRDDNAGGGGGGNGPASQIASACAGLAAGDLCTLSAGPGQIQSTCEVDASSGELRCKLPHAPPWFFACLGASEGDGCTVDKGPEMFDGTCQALDGVISLACLPEDFDPSSSGGVSAQAPSNWIAAHTVPGCEAGIQLEQVGGGQGTITVGGAGGYGGIYCFALTP